MSQLLFYVTGGMPGSRLPKGVGYLIIGSMLAFVAAILVVPTMRFLTAARRYLWAIIPGAILGGALFYWVAVTVIRAAQNFMGG